MGELTNDTSKPHILMKRTLRSCFTALLLLAVAGGMASASDLFTYQGKLTNAGGAALADGQYRIGVKVWNEANGGATPLWARKYDVPVTGGVFSLMIGAEGVPWGVVDTDYHTNSLKLAVSGTKRFLEITVMSDADGGEKPEAQWQRLSPRQALGAVPYAMNGVPPGTVVPFAGAVVPEGWVLCDGSLLDRGDPRYAPLYAAIQTTYGSGDGNTFRVPDLKGRAVIGSGQGDTWTGAGGATNWALGTKFGAEKHQITEAEMPRHNHNFDDPGHSHNWGPSQRTPKHYGSGSVRTAYDFFSGGYGEVTTKNKTDIKIEFQGQDVPHNNMQPSLVLNYIIKL